MSTKPADFVRVGFRYPNAAQTVAVESGFGVIGLTVPDVNGGQIFWFASLDEFNQHRRDVVEGVGRHGVNIPVPVVEVLSVYGSEVINDDLRRAIKAGIRIGAEYQNGGLTVEVHGQFSMIGTAMPDPKRGVPIFWFKDLDHFNAVAADVWEIRRGVYDVPIPVVEVPSEWPEGMVSFDAPAPAVPAPTPNVPAFAEGGGESPIVPTTPIADEIIADMGNALDDEESKEELPAADLSDTDQPREAVAEESPEDVPTEDPKGVSDDLAKSVVDYVTNSTEKVRITTLAKDLGCSKDDIKAILNLPDSPIKQNAAGVITLNR